MGNAFYRVLENLRKVLIEMGDGTHAERVIAHPPFDLLTDGGDGPNRRIRVDVGQTGFWGGREFRISLELNISTTPLWLRFSAPVGFILQNQELNCDQGGIRLRAFRASQGTPSGSFDTPVDIWANNGLPGTPAYSHQVTINSGGSFTPTPGQSAAETIRCMSNPGGGGPTAGSRNTVSGSAFGERGLPIGDFYLGFERIAGTTVDGLGVFNLVWEERP
ncbi:hypothetical protein [Pseudomonas aeruginosa]|uniref:hypothetical protein n=1 Tax=Pseudomonas aeruginosa TaxID=287 RepID=UPI0011B67411|nr:hypothetical protein [Pseudomonas aeruginosa]TWW38951.1 hypothetical protein FSB80_22530 [Pseudomonas aeruginosa]TWX98673.1 hypothetical protein FS694_21970 [Pseudomonas aeruginosa]